MLDDTALLMDDSKNNITKQLPLAIPVFLSVYQAVSCALSLLMYTIAFWSFWVSTGEPIIFLFISIILIFYVGYIGYINLIFVLKGKAGRSFLGFNQVFNFLQLFHFSILGVVYYFIAGPEITPAFFYSDKVLWQIQSHFFNLRFNLSFHGSDSDINAGINLIPLLCLLMLNFWGKYVQPKT